MYKSVIPEWLLVSQGPLPPLTPEMGLPRRKNFLEKTIDGLTSIMRDEFFAETVANYRGLLQEIHPAAKILTTFLLLIVAISLHSWVTILLLNLWVLLLVRLSAIPLTTFLKRVWLVVPLFTAIMIFPSLFNYVVPGTPWLVIGHFGHPLHFGPWTFPAVFAITRQGVMGAVVFILRVGACVSLAVLMTLTSHWSALMKAFRNLHLPLIFVTVLSMAYRYIYVLLLSVSDMFMARKSRTVGRTTNKEQRQFVSTAMGSLWEKSFELSEEVHAAMLARGFTGEPRTLVYNKMCMVDWFWSVFMALVSLIMIGGDRLLG
jgi:cobalt/nickel transport system permease protein